MGARPDNWTPTAQEVGALPSTYTPPNQTAEQVGADPKGTATTLVSQHNTADDSHNDIRLELKAINDRLTAFFDSDDQTLDELSEIVSYITNNKTLIESITTSKVSVADIVNNLTTNVGNKPLSAAQGVVMKGLIDGLSAGKMDANKLQDAVNDALAQAKASGEFDGKDGSNGVSPTISVSAITGGHRITITDANGTKTVDIMDGSDGQDGQDGGVGAAGRGIKTITRTSGNGAAGTTDTYTITYTDNTTSTFAVYNGKDGATGGTGPAGANATINGVNALTIAAGDGISASQSGSTLNLSVVGNAPAYTYSTTDLTAGTSALTTGKMYLVYE